jgi:hypothetical protein
MFSGFAEGAEHGTFPLFLVPAVFFLLLGILIPASTAYLGVVPVALIFFHLYSHLFRAKAPPRTETAGTSVRLMTFNIWFHSARRLWQEQEQLCLTRCRPRRRNT